MEKLRSMMKGLSVNCNEVQKALVHNEIAYIDSISDTAREYLKSVLGVTDLDDWTIMSKVYDFMEVNKANEIEAVGLGLIKPQYHLRSFDNVRRPNRLTIATPGSNLLLSVKVPFYVASKYDEHYFGWNGDIQSR